MYLRFSSVSVLAYLLGAAVLLSACQSSGRLQGERALSNTPYGYTVTSEIARAGSKSQRFEVRAGDCAAAYGWSDCDNDRERSEVSLINNVWRPGTNKWFGFSVYLPKDFQTSPRVRTTVGQIKMRGGPTGMAEGLKSIPGIIQLEMQGNRYFACLHILSGPRDNIRDVCREINLSSISAMRERWTDIQIRLDTRIKGGLFEIYVNGQRKALVTNFNSQVPKDYYAKYGIYRSFVSKHGGPMPTQILFIDEVKIGDSLEDVVVTPGNPID